MIVSQNYHEQSYAIFKLLSKKINILCGGTEFKLGNIKINVKGKDGVGGLIEEWFGVWAESNSFEIHNPKKVSGASQEFPDYYVGKHKNGYLEVKTFDADASPNFDIANFESYCESLSENPHRLFSDYLIFSYKLKDTVLRIENIWLKKIWQITCRSSAYPLKTQNKRGIIYNIRPASFHSTSNRVTQFPIFTNPLEFTEALYGTQKMYNNKTNDAKKFKASLIKNNIDLANL